MKSVETAQSGGARNAPVWSSFLTMLRKSKLPWGWLILTLALTFGYSSVYLMFPDYTEQVINGDISTRTIATFVVVIVGSMALNAASSFLSGLTSAKMTRSMERSAWRAVSELPVARVEAENNKELISRITADSTSVSMLLSNFLPYMLQELYLTIGSLAAASEYDSSMLWTLAVLLIAQLAMAFISGKCTFKFNNKAQKKMAEMTELVAEVMANLPLVKIFSAQEKESKRGEAAISGYYRSSLFAQNISNAFYYISRFLNLVGALTVVILGGYLTSQGRLDIGGWIAYFMYYQMMSSSAQMLLYYWKEIKSCQGKLYRLSAVVAAEGEDLTSGESVAPCGGDFAFDHVRFSYGEKPVLRDVSFTIPAGKLTAIAGENGAGKTTALSLLERFYQPDGGKITYAGRDAAGLKLSDWRDLFSYVPQDVRLMAGTLRENLTYGLGRPVTEQELAEACRKSRADLFLSKLPRGLDTPVEEFGDNLSGGQKQQLAIARAILRDRECLLLDEFTSNLDPESEEHVLASLEELRKEKTIVIIAHKMSTVERAENIVMLEQGTVQAVGTHDTLLKDCSLYQEMIRAQSAEANA